MGDGGRVKEGKVGVCGDMREGVDGTLGCEFLVASTLY